MTGFRATFSNKPQIPVLPSWLLRLAAPVLLIVTLPLAALVFAIALGAAGALAASRFLARSMSAPARPAAAGFGPVIEGEYVVVAEHRHPARSFTERR
jgi:hypothetical protein